MALSGRTLDVASVHDVRRELSPLRYLSVFFAIASFGVSALAIAVDDAAFTLVGLWMAVNGALWCLAAYGLGRVCGWARMYTIVLCWLGASSCAAKLAGLVSEPSRLLSFGAFLALLLLPVYAYSAVYLLRPSTKEKFQRARRWIDEHERGTGAHTGTRA